MLHLVALLAAFAASPIAASLCAQGSQAPRWQDWWRTNRAGFLQVRAAIDRALGIDDSQGTCWTRPGSYRETLRPTPSQLDNSVLPGLKRILDASNSSPTLRADCLLALAETRTDHDDYLLVPMLVDGTRSEQRVVREAGILGLGVSRHPNAREPLKRLTSDETHDSRGRALAELSLALHRRSSASSPKPEQLDSAELGAQPSFVARWRSGWD